MPKLCVLLYSCCPVWQLVALCQHCNKAIIIIIKKLQVINRPSEVRIRNTRLDFGTDSDLDNFFHLSRAF